jgi:DNA-binding PucR family transcriptional regulator
MALALVRDTPGSPAGASRAMTSAARTGAGSTGAGSTGAGSAAPGTWEWLLGVVSEVALVSPTASASAGGSVSRTTDLDRSRREASEVRRLRDAGRVTGPAMTVEDAWAAVTNARALAGIRTDELLGPVAVLRAHDEAHETAYLETVAAWLDHPGDPKAAAARVHVHPNTLRYRMQRLSEVVDVDLHDPETRLALRLQLRALGH